jgi:transposase
MAEAEIITRRRKWAAEEKAALLAEVEAEGGRVAVVARRHGLSQSLLYNWRSIARATVPGQAPGAIEFRPIGVVGATNGALAALPAGSEHRLPGEDHRDERADKIEIALPNGVRLKVDGLASEQALLRVLRALKGAV